MSSMSVCTGMDWGLGERTWVTHIFFSNKEFTTVAHLFPILFLNQPRYFNTGGILPFHQPILNYALRVSRFASWKSSNPHFLDLLRSSEKNHFPPRVNNYFNSLADQTTNDYFLQSFGFKGCIHFKCSYLKSLYNPSLKNSFSFSPSLLLSLSLYIYLHF